MVSFHTAYLGPEPQVFNLESKHFTDCPSAWLTPFFYSLLLFLDLDLQFFDMALLLIALLRELVTLILQFFDVVFLPPTLFGELVAFILQCSEELLILLTLLEEIIALFLDFIVLLLKAASLFLVLRVFSLQFLDAPPFAFSSWLIALITLSCWAIVLA